MSINPGSAIFHEPYAIGRLHLLYSKEAGWTYPALLKRAILGRSIMAVASKTPPL